MAASNACCGSVSSTPSNVQAGSKCHNKKTRSVQLSRQSGKQFMPLGVSGPHGLGQAGNVRSQVVGLRLKKYASATERTGS